MTGADCRVASRCVGPLDDLCYPIHLAGDPRLQTLVSVVQSNEYRRQLAELPGFGVSESGHIHQIG